MTDPNPIGSQWLRPAGNISLAERGTWDTSLYALVSYVVGTDATVVC